MDSGNHMDATMSALSEVFLPLEEQEYARETWKDMVGQYVVSVQDDTDSV